MARFNPRPSSCLAPCGLALCYLAPCYLALCVACSAGGAREEEALVLSNQGDDEAPPDDDVADAPAPTANAPEPPSDGLFDDDDLEPEDECDNVLPVTYRDFSHDHVDFEMAFSGDEPRLHLLEPELGADGKPVFLDGVGCPRDNQRHRECNAGFNPTEPVITGAASFDQWYRNVAGVNVAFEREIELTETPVGSGVYTYQSNAFFPLEPSEGFGETPPGQGRNFLFTTEIHSRFTYVAGQVFTFRGDDDLWIFVNGRLALDLGGMHGEREASIDFDAQAEELGIAVGSDYAMDVFHAERHTSASNFYMETNIACFRPGIVR